MSTKHLLALLLLAVALGAQAQAPAAPAYDTTNYPAERRLLKRLFLLTNPTNPSVMKSFCSDNDFIAVGPEGAVSYGPAQWKAGIDQSRITFKSLSVVPGSDVLRLYGGTTAVRNWRGNLVLGTPGGEARLVVQRLEVYVKKGTQWCLVAGQDTPVAPAGPPRNAQK